MNGCFTPLNKAGSHHASTNNRETNLWRCSFAIVGLAACTAAIIDGSLNQRGPLILKSLRVPYIGSTRSTLARQRSSAASAIGCDASRSRFKNDLDAVVFLVQKRRVTTGGFLQIQPMRDDE